MGRALLAHLAKLAKERNCGRLEWSVLDWNELAIRLYKGVGAVPMDEWTVYRVAREALDKLAARVRPSCGPLLRAADSLHLGKPRAKGGSMTEERRSFWDRIFNTRTSNERERKVVEYVVHRIGEGAHLGDVLQEEYVRRNASSEEIETILDNPRLVETAREEMRKDFSSGELDPRRRPT